MKSNLIILALLCGFIVLHCIRVHGQATIPLPLEVRAEVTQSTEANLPVKVLVTLHNQSPSAELGNVVVKIGRAGSPDLESPSIDLKPGQVRLQTFDVRPNENNLYIATSYVWNNQPHSLGNAVTRPIPASVWPALLPVISTLVGGIVGAWLVNYFTRRRERVRADFEWSKMLFEKYESSFRVFLASWQDLSSTVALETEYKNLVQNAYVPVNIRKNYTQTIAILSDESKKAEHKLQAGKKFKELVERFLTHPSHN